MLNAIDHYISVIRGNNFNSTNLTLTEVLRLENLRLELRISPAQRDMALTTHGYNIASFDPNMYIRYCDPELESAIRKKVRAGEHACYRCKSGFRLWKKTSCCYCRHAFCRHCFYNIEMRIIEYRWEDKHRVCIDCAARIMNQEDLLKQIRLKQNVLPRTYIWSSAEPPTPGAPSTAAVDHVAIPQQCGYYVSAVV